MTTLDKYLLRNFIFAYLAIFACLVIMYIVIDVFTKFEEFTVADSSRIARKAQRAQAFDTTGQNYTIEAEKLIPNENNAWQRIRSFCKNVTVFYAYRLPVFFQRVNGIMLLLAGAFTIGLMESQNELIPVLSSGVPIWRLLIPIGCMASIFLIMQVLDTEMVIPHCADHLLRQAEDPMGKRPLLVPGTFDEKHVHVDARVAYPQRQMIQHARVTLPAS
ncbi:MAG TPA: LptF/LptG family permease, partial [Gemmatales bacterium]|nr:LptF/LptG family permease [Gemmatales bacterium]